MGTTTITGPQVWPTQNDLYGSGVSGSTGDGKKHREKQWRKVALPLGRGNNAVLSGGTLPATDPDLTIQVAAGKAIIDGHYVEWPATNVTLPASSTSHLFVKLQFSGDLITAVAIEDNTSDTPPASSVKLGSATTSGTAVTATSDHRILGPGAQEMWAAGGTYKVPAGIFRAKIRIWGASGGGGGGGGGYESGIGNGNSGGTGGAGGTTSLGSLLSVNGSTGGGGGGGGTNFTPGANGSQGTGGTSTGVVSVPASGRQGGRGGRGGDGVGGSYGGDGAPGGWGSYAEKIVDLTPGATHTVTIGAAGTAGSAGSGGFGSGNDAQGIAGEAGLAGIVVIEYL